ncbi:hypothetical protein CAEBREN_31349 [Caenorhabditis brenneri]|uniref:Uncharacterized protein n=1 Tax=Caenorhabditis brenneri TaxID=135651 RepID=G0ME78_CAEBE|nr:hypothetical protein CAEBREN_31349 [Caenorhabditis brenneri]
MTNSNRKGGSREIKNFMGLRALFFLSWSRYESSSLVEKTYKSGKKKE